MNKTEVRGKKWLMSNFGLKPNEIEYTGEVPTFVTSKGTSFLTKRVIGKKNKITMLYPSEVSRIMKDPDKSSLLLVSDDGEVKQMPARLLAEEDRESYDGIKLVHSDPEVKGRPDGAILLHVLRRTADSRYYRINHVPMDSMLLYRDYTGHLSVSSANGHHDFWLVLRPENFGIG